MSKNETVFETILRKQDEKLDVIYASVEKTRKYFLWSMIGQLIFLLLPLLALAFMIPFVLSSFSKAFDGLL